MKFHTSQRMFVSTASSCIAWEKVRLNNFIFFLTRLTLLWGWADGDTGDTVRVTSQHCQWSECTWIMLPVTCFWWESGQAVGLGDLWKPLPTILFCPILSCPGLSYPNPILSLIVSYPKLQKLFRCFKALLILAGKYKKITETLVRLQRKKTRKRYLRNENKYMPMKPARIKVTSFGTPHKERQSLLIQFTEMSWSSQAPKGNTFCIDFLQ